MSTKQEDFTNRALAQLLKEQGLETDFEQRAGRKKMDVVAHVDGLRVVLEAETGFHRKSQAIKDADARLTQRLTTAVFAVCYPAGVTEETLRDANLTWTLRTRAGESVGAWSEGGVSQLAQAVQQTPGSLSGADVAAQQLSDALDVAVARLTPAGREALAKALDLPATKGATSAGERYRVAGKRGMLVIATAMLFHHRVQAHLASECPDEYDGDWPPLNATACAEQEEVIAAHREAWRGILAVDYKPVFETGRTALAAIPADPDTGQAIRALAETVAGISEKMSGLPARPAGTHLPPRAGHRPVRRFLLHLHRRSGAAGHARSPEAGHRLGRPQRHRQPPDLRPGLRDRYPAHGSGRADQGPPERHWAAEF